MELYTSTKKLSGYPCTHRQWKADSHCRFVHGYSRDFYFEFACSEMSDEFWVMDFGGLKAVKEFLAFNFDHTFLIAQDDPYLEKFKIMDKDRIIQLRVLPNPGMEGTAKFVYDEVQKIITSETKGRVWVTKVEVKENEKNSAIYRPNTLK